MKGFTVFAGIISVGRISGDQLKFRNKDNILIFCILGAAFNPAVGTGPNIVDTALGHGNSAKYIWIYWVGPLLGGALASIVFRVTNTAEYRRSAAIATGKSTEKEGYSPIIQNEDTPY